MTIRKRCVCDGCEKVAPEVTEFSEGLPIGWIVVTVAAGRDQIFSSAPLHLCPDCRPRGDEHEPVHGRLPDLLARRLCHPSENVLQRERESTS